MTKMLSQKELAADLGVSQDTLKAWRDQGLPHLRLTDAPKSPIFYTRSDVERWIRENRRVPPLDPRFVDHDPPFVPPKECP